MTIQAAKIIETNIEDLTEKWLFAVSKRETDDTRIGHEQVRNILVQVLKALAAVLDDKEHLYLFESHGSIFKKAKVLGELRRAQGYELEEVLQEYLILRKEVWALMRKNLGKENVDIFEIEERINFCLMSVLKATIESFHHRQTKDLNRLAITDSLTGLFNRGQFDKIIDQEIYRADRYDRPLALGLIDVDYFKLFNDLNGHQAGDMALEKTATLIRQFLRSTDAPARYGGEEFAVVLPEISQDEAYKVCSRIRRGVERKIFFENEKQKGKLTVSIGVSLYPDDADSAEKLIAAADKALYKAKNQGRNRVVCFSDLKEKLGSGWFASLKAR